MAENGSFVSLVEHGPIIRNPTKSAPNIGSVWIWPVKQITKRTPLEDGDPRPQSALFAVMTKMAALTKRLQIARPIVAGIVIEMCRRQQDQIAPLRSVPTNQSDNTNEAQV